MGWIKVILDLLAKGLGWWNSEKLLEAGRKEQREKDNAKAIAALKARDSISESNADSMLKPPAER